MPDGSPRRLINTIALVFASLAFAISGQSAQKLLVISVDGMDQRYLDRRDQTGLRIPNVRKLIREGSASKGVIGVIPTITWPSHTTLITGVEPAVHGIRSNRRPQAEGGDYPWSVRLLKARTLLDAAHEAGRTTATVTWPVTVDSSASFNLPEYFQRRRGGAMDLRSISSKARPADLVSRITGMFPSFAQEWMDDRTRTQAVVYLLKTEKPDLILVHLVDLDSEEHDNGPFTSESNAVLEYTDELIGQMLNSLPAGYAVALVSDHGFERVEQVVNVKGLAAQRMIQGVDSAGAITIARTPEAAALLKELSANKEFGVGRQIPEEELRKFAPDLAKVDAAFESLPGFQFGAGKDPQQLFSKPHEIGNHGHWPTRYRAVFVLWGATGKAQVLPELPMTDIASRLASVMGLNFTPGPR